MKRIATLFIFLFASVLAACGGSNDSPSEPAALDGAAMEQVAQAWADAFGAGNIDAMCDLTDDPGAPGDVDGCKGVYEDNEYARSMADQSIERSDYFGNEGVVQFSNGDVIQMRVKGDEWVVSDFGGKQPFRVGYDSRSE